MLTFQQHYPQIRFFERHVGLFYTKNGQPVKINKKGMYDLWAMIPLKEKTILAEFELKTGSSYKSKDQIKWGEFLDFMNVPHFEVRENNFEDIKKALNEIIQG